MLSRLLGVALPFLLLAAPAGAGAERMRDQDDLRAAVERGEIRPFTELMATVRDKLPGEITGVEAERDNGKWLYEFHVVNDKGHLFEVFVDARDGAIIRIREK